MQDKGAPAAVPDEPRTVGYKHFQGGKQAAEYFRKLLNSITKNQDLNEVPLLRAQGCPCHACSSCPAIHASRQCQT